jgi:hypothetical protein
MLKRCREIEVYTTPVIGSTSETGKPVANRSCSCAAAEIDAGATRVRMIHAIGVIPTFSVGGVGHLRLRNEHRRLRVAVVQTAGVGIGDDADDLALGLVFELAHHAAPIAIRSLMMSFEAMSFLHRFVDDHRRAARPCRHAR